MSNTATLGLPLLQPSQAQKHVTVNEAMARLDGLCQMALQSISETAPPVSTTDGAVYAVPAGASGDWEGLDGQVAVFSNGGWVYLTPQAGWRAHVVDVGVPAVFDGTDWQLNGVVASTNGATSFLEVLEFDHSIAAGGTDQTSIGIPSYAIVMGVSARVLSEISGSLSSWRLGVPGSDNRYGSGLGVNTGSWVQGLSGQPLTYYSDTPLLLTAEGGGFSAGEIRFALHLFRIGLPRA
ncbi:MAG: DUF2793 domain-containing protein [Pseudomonadota bacterium]